ncbi:hypothetical protein [Polaribacter cellanae]|uniref:Uncharacterized protein n=1 Tax=Polaribacter cellanae TaxID=2818493 RepID=A0A975CKE1_9FLAO|nr:hypothetical protein [Polaribacter cellanae]QTE21308.1 hypothetical protein J3359_10755 [Polaribacter cellanae]
MKYILIIISFLSISITFGQNKKSPLYLRDYNPIINSDELGNLYYIFSIKSIDKTFNNDAYKFIVPNKIGFDKFKKLEEVENKIAIDTLSNFINVTHLKKYNPCELHKNLSIRRTIFLVYKNKYSENVFIPLIYEGTQKNIEVLKFK